MRLSVEWETVGKSAVLLTMRRYGEGKISTEAADFTLSRKAAGEAVGARTVNRHRWVGRES